MCWCDANQQRQRQRIDVSSDRCGCGLTRCVAASDTRLLSWPCLMPGCDKRSSLRRLVSCFWPGLNESVTTATTTTFRAHVRHAHLSSSSSSCTKVNHSEISQGRHVALDSYQISVPQIVLHTMRNYLGVHISFSLAAEGFPRPPSPSTLPLHRFLLLFSTLCCCCQLSTHLSIFMASCPRASSWCWGRELATVINRNL